MTSKDPAIIDLRYLAKVGGLPPCPECDGCSHTVRTIKTRKDGLYVLTLRCRTCGTPFKLRCAAPVPAKGLMGEDLGIVISTLESRGKPSRPHKSKRK